MNEILQACSIFEVSADAEWIELFPAGITRGFDGRGPYHLKDADTVIAASRREKVDLVIDRDHQADLAPKGTAIKAAGWMKELQVRDGAVWARVEWTPAAKAELASKEYRYISPTFLFNKQTGEVTRILRASLTNIPNLELKAVASADPNCPNTNQEDHSMDKHLLAIAAMLGLANPETPEAVVESAKAHLAAATSLQTEIASIRKALGLKEDAKADAVIETASQLATGKETADPSKFVPMEMHRELASQLTALQEERSSEKATAAVDAAIKAGKITPAQKDWALGYAKQSLDGFNDFVAKQPVIVQGGEQAGGKAAETAGQLSEDELAICSQLGLDPEEYKKADKKA